MCSVYLRWGFAMKGLLVFLLLLTCSGVADVKMRVRVQRGKMPVRESVHYAKGQRQRIETPNAPLIRITQCDLKRAVLLNPYTKRYLVIDFQKVASEFDQSALEISETAAQAKDCSLDELSAATCRTAREFFPKLI